MGVSGGVGGNFGTVSRVGGIGTGMIFDGSVCVSVSRCAAVGGVWESMSLPTACGGVWVDVSMVASLVVCVEISAIFEGCNSKVGGGFNFLSR